MADAAGLADDQVGSGKRGVQTARRVLLTAVVVQEKRPPVRSITGDRAARWTPAPPRTAQRCSAGAPWARVPQPEQERDPTSRHAKSRFGSHPFGAAALMLGLHELDGVQPVATFSSPPRSFRPAGVSLPIGWLRLPIRPA